MRQWLERTFNITILSFAEHNGERESYQALVDGQLVVAESLGLLLATLVGEDEDLRAAA